MNRFSSFLSWNLFIYHGYTISCLILSFTFILLLSSHCITRSSGNVLILLLLLCKTWYLIQIVLYSVDTYPTAHSSFLFYPDDMSLLYSALSLPRIKNDRRHLTYISSEEHIHLVRLWENYFWILFSDSLPTFEISAYGQ